jgi:hypothetical protein
LSARGSDAKAQCAGDAMTARSRCTASPRAARQRR